MINEIIVRYLTENKRLVVPGFGAFIRKEETGEVVFVEFLKKDDRVLTSLLEKMYGLSTVEALSAISDYVEKVKDQIEAGGRFLIPGLGWLHANVNGVTDLEYNPGAKASPGVKPEAKSAPTPVQPVTETAKGSPKAASETASPKSGRVSAASSAIPVQPRPAVDSASRPTTPRVEPIRPQKPVETVSREYERPSRTMNDSRKKKRADLIMIVAIVAAIIALISMVYGIFVNSAPDINLQKIVPVEQVDTTAVLPSATE